MTEENQFFEPRFPRTIATGILTLWIGLLSLPMLSGNFIAAIGGDQYSTGYAFRHWAAAQWKALGHYPLWNPEIYAGMPFVGGMHGDLFYPTAFLRLILPTHTAMNIGFFLHYVLAGVFVYWFLRTWRVSWAGSVVGGLAFQLSGVIGSYVRPGHDGKLFVTALLPLGLIALTYAIRDKRWEGYGLFALTVGLSLLSPHPQMVQYYLLAAGIFALYLTIGETSSEPMLKRLTPLAYSLIAIVVGVGISAVQYIPFYEYIPFSPRSNSVLDDFVFSTSYAIPWNHFPELMISRFAGEAFNGTYFGSNGLKLHSEYLGLPVLALAAFGAVSKERRKFIMWLGGVGMLFLLVAMGSATPFYRLWWEIVPFVKSTRAPGMALFVVSFVVATLAAFGADRLQQSQPKQWINAWLGVGGAILLLGVTGILGALAESIAQGVEMAMGFPRVQNAIAAQDNIRLGASLSGLALIAVAGVAWLVANKKVTGLVLVATMIGVVGTDMWLNARPFWIYSRAQDEIFRDDEIKSYLRQQPKPYRVFDTVYPGSTLMAHNIAQWYGHHGNELQSFDVINGRRGTGLDFAHQGNPSLMELFAVRYIIANAAGLPDSLPGFRTILSGVPSAVGVATTLLERTDPPPYAWLVADAVVATLEQTAATVIDQRFPIDRVVLVQEDSALRPGPMSNPMPEPIDAEITFATWEPGRMVLNISGGSPRPAYLVVSENYYKDWMATVDGEDALVGQGNGTLITVPISAGAREVELTYDRSDFDTAVKLTIASLLIAMATMIAPPILRRRKGD